MRLFAIFVLLALLFLVPFLIWGGEFEAALGGQAAETWLRARGGWAWAAGIGLLVADLVLPVPATAVIAALGLIYKPLLGGLFGALGSFLAGLLAWGATRLAGRRVAVFLAGERDLARGERFFARHGGLAVALSRWLPILPEAVACLAGMSRMPARRFLVALACGSLPLGFAFAAFGWYTGKTPVAALVLSALLPLLFWLPARWLLRTGEHTEKGEERLPARGDESIESKVFNVTDGKF